VIHAGGRDWYTANEVPDIWPDVTPEAVRQWAARGKVNGHRVGRHTYYDLNDLTEAEHAARTAGRGSRRGMAHSGPDQVHS
jgi:ribosomal protein L19E